MRVVLQRVKHASCTIDGQITGSIDKGFCLFVGFTDTDTFDIVHKMASKISKLRLFEDENGKMNLSLNDVNGSFLSISQFTLYGDAKKGNRPSFVRAMKANQATVYYDRFNEELQNLGYKVETGIFGADMKIDLLNDGPVTLMLDDKELFGCK